MAPDQSEGSSSRYQLTGSWSNDEGGEGGCDREARSQLKELTHGTQVTLIVPVDRGFDLEYTVRGFTMTLDCMQGDLGAPHGIDCLPVVTCAASKLR